jgi:hypothetical protein
MTTYLHTGTAPYTSLTFNKFMTAAHSTDEFGGVIPNRLNDLRVIGGGGGSVTVQSGIAILNHVVFMSDSDVSLAISPNATLSTRFDYIILRTDLLKQEARLMVLEGVFNNYALFKEYSDEVSSSAKSLTQEDTVLDMVLAVVTMPAGATFVQNYYIKDERTFAPRQKYGEGRHNLLRNSEYLAVCSLVATPAPENWYYDTTPTSLTLGELVTSASLAKRAGRGRFITLTDGTLRQDIYLTKVPSVLSIAGILENTASDKVFSVTLDVLDALGNVLETWQENYTSVLNDAIKVNATIRFVTTDCAALRLSIGCASGTIIIHPFILCTGYFTGTFRPFHETIMLKQPLVNVAYDGDAFSTGTVALDLPTFNALVPLGLKGVIFRIRARDGGSAGAAAGSVGVTVANTTTLPYSGLELAGITNDVWREVQVAIQFDYVNLGTGISLDIRASGAGTLDLYLQLIGLIT